MAVTDPFSGKDFGYRKQGKSFLLYSVGVNLQDDGGKHDPLWEKDDFVFWPVQKPGVLTLPRATK